MHPELWKLARSARVNQPWPSSYPRVPFRRGGGEKKAEGARGDNEGIRKREEDGAKRVDRRTVGYRDLADSLGIRNVILAARRSDIIALVCLQAAP